MKKTRIRQMIFSILGSLVCSVSVMGCYPLVPAYFTALYLEQVNGVMLLAFMYIGMTIFMPLTAAVKYGVTLIVMIGAVKLIEWANEGCPAFLAGVMAGLTTLILSFCGSLLEWKNQPAGAAVFLESIFIFGAVILLNRSIHFLMEWTPVQQKTEDLPETGNGERLKNYAESFQGLSQIFLNMSTGKEKYAADELGRVQNELTGKVCASCDSCTLCWERDCTPLYGILSSMITSIWQKGEPGAENEAELKKYCAKSRDMVEEAVRVFERVSLNHAWYNRLLENRQVIAEQLDAMAYIMQDCAREERVLDAQERRAISEIRYRAKEKGISIEEIHLIETLDGRLKLSATLKSRRGGCIALKSFVTAAEHALGKQMRAAADTKTFISRELRESKKTGQKYREIIFLFWS